MLDRKSQTSLVEFSEFQPWLTSNVWADIDRLTELIKRHGDTNKLLGKCFVRDKNTMLCRAARQYFNAAGANAVKIARNGSLMHIARLYERVMRWNEYEPASVAWERAKEGERILIAAVQRALRHSKEKGSSDGSAA